MKRSNIYKMLSMLAILVTGFLSQSNSIAQNSNRPESLTLESFQFGPVNRWSFSHMREILPTVNIPRDPDRFHPLEKSDDFVADFSVAFQGRKQSLGVVFVK